jgi:hypothetical protein
VVRDALVVELVPAEYEAVHTIAFDEGNHSVECGPMDIGVMKVECADIG